MDVQYMNQRDSDNYLSATHVINLWNTHYGEAKQLNNYQKNSSTKLFIAKLKEEGIEQPLITERGRYSTGTWMHPKLFIDFCMWVSLDMKSWIIEYLISSQ